MAQTILGIDLGSYSVKLVQLQRGFGEFKLVNFFEVPLISDSVLSHQQTASAALSKFFSENPIVFDSCVVSMPGNLLANRFVELPFTNSKKIDQTIEFELETLVPFEIEEVVYDYAIMERGENETKVLMTYTREEEFKNFLNLLQVSGCDPRYVGSDALDLSYLTMLGVLPPHGRYALLDLGHSKSNLLILDGSQVKGVRTLSWGGHDITLTIAKACDLSYEDAEKFKHHQGRAAEQTEDPGLQAIYEQMEDLTQQLKQTLFAFYETGEEPIEALYLSGGTSRMEGLESFFSKRLNINVGMMELLEEPYTEIHDQETARPIIATAFAAALHGANPNKGMKINFRRGPYAYKKDIEELGGSLKKIGALAASVVGIGVLYFIISYMTLSSQVEAMNKNVAGLVRSSIMDIPPRGIKSSKSALSILEGKISAINEKLKKVEGDSSLSALKVLQMLSSSLPPRDQLVVDIDNINVSPQRVKLEGRTNSYEAVDKMKSSIERVSVFKNVQSGNVRKGVKDEIKFSLSFDVLEGQENP